MLSFFTEQAHLSFLVWCQFIVANAGRANICIVVFLPHL